jgi:hypothetical protein
MAFDVIRYLSDSHIQYWTSGKNCQPGWVNVQCPFCGDHSNHLGINLSAANCFCWKCGGKSLWRVIHTLTPKLDPDAVQEKYEDAPRIQIMRKRAEALHLEMPGDPLPIEALRYLKGRKFDPLFLEQKYHLTYGGISGDWRYRILTPVYDRNGKLLTYQGRDITGQQEERYKTLSVVKSVQNPKDILFNIQNCNKDIVGVLEGTYDVFRMGDDYVCGLGTTMTQKQIIALSEFKKVVFIFDPEEIAQKKAKRYAEQLACLGTEVEILDIGLDHDPGDCTQEEVGQIHALTFG